MNKVYLLLLLLIFNVAYADHYPGHAILELGIGTAALTTPDFRGSSQQQNQLLPFPYVKYRGDRLRVDDGIEGRLFESPNLLLSISGNGSLPTSDDNPEREGMPQLDATLEIGPSLEYRLFQNTDYSLWLELPLRYAITIDSDPESAGRILHPRLAWRKPAQNKYDWKLRVAGGPLYADQEFHAYYYNVNSDQVTAQRASFKADSGYSGLRLDFTFSRRRDQFWYGGFVRFDSLNDSEIEDSPLVSEKESWTAGIALAWVISEK